MSKSMSNNVFKKKSGIQSIQEYLESGRSITALESLSNFGIFRLASSIELLRKRGMNIQTEMKKDPNGKTYARYTLAAPEEAKQEQRKFKAGDRVAINEEFPHKERHGMVGVVEVEGYELPYPYRVRFEGEGHAPLFSESELTLLPAEAPKKELKVGARVRVLDTYPCIDGLRGHEGIVHSVHQNYSFPFAVQFSKGYGVFTANELEVI